MFLLIVNLIWASSVLLRTLRHSQSRKRGTNALTRFVRDGAAYYAFSSGLTLSGAASVVTLIISLMLKSKPVYACLPTVLTAVLCFVNMRNSNKDTQRVKDSRYVTKTTGKGASAAVSTVGATAAGAATLVKTQNLAAAKLATEATRTAGDIAGKCFDSMEVEGNVPDINKEDFTEITKAVVEISNPEEFIKSCARAGIETNGQDLGAIAAKVIQFAPEAQLKSLPKDYTDEQKAMALMSGVI